MIWHSGFARMSNVHPYWCQSNPTLSGGFPPFVVLFRIKNDPHFPARIEKWAIATKAVKLKRMGESFCHFRKRFPSWRTSICFKWVAKNNHLVMGLNINLYLRDVYQNMWVERNPFKLTQTSKRRCFFQQWWQGKKEHKQKYRSLSHFSVILKVYRSYTYTHAFPQFCMYSLFFVYLNNLPTPQSQTISKTSRKLELMGEHTCPRWHRDHYCGRGIVSYNLSGTQYVAEVRSPHRLGFW